MVVHISITEDSLFEFDTVADEMLTNNPTFREDGVFTFDLGKGGEGTSVQELISKFRVEFACSLKRINPIASSSSPDFFGHISFDSLRLEQAVVASQENILSDPTSYEVKQNCCVSVLNEGGTEALCNHYFEDFLPKNAKKPPMRCKEKSVPSLKRKATTTRKAHEALKAKICTLKAVADKASLLTSMLQSQANDSSGPCLCEMCSFSDEIHNICQETGQVTVDPEATEHYYRGKGCYYASGINVNAQKMNRVSANFSLSLLPAVTLTPFLGGPFPGISSSYMYFGLLHSFFPVHIEDMSLWSVNFLHCGYPKLWVVISPSHIAKLLFFIAKERTNSEQSNCLGALCHKYFMLTVSWLERNNIQSKIVLQREGEGVCLAPNAAHFGFNLGPNVAEAINFASKLWIPYGITYPKCNCMGGEIHCDLSSIILAYYPQMFEAYQKNKIPIVKDQPNFNERNVHPKIWDEAYVGNVGVETPHVQEASPNEEVEEKSLNPVLIPRKKKKPMRKILSCPLCQQTYAGGHKQRLYSHIEHKHHDLPVEAMEQAKLAVSKWFPEWGNRLSKKECDICGKGIAGSMKEHQASKGCKR